MFKFSEERHYSVIDLVFKALGGKGLINNKPQADRSKEFLSEEEYSKLSSQEKDEIAERMSAFHKSKVMQMFSGARGD